MPCCLGKETFSCQVHPIGSKKDAMLCDDGGIPELPEDDNGDWEPPALTELPSDDDGSWDPDSEERACSSVVAVPRLACSSVVVVPRHLDGTLRDDVVELYSRPRVVPVAAARGIACYLECGFSFGN